MEDDVEGSPRKGQEGFEKKKITHARLPTEGSFVSLRSGRALPIEGQHQPRNRRKIKMDGFHEKQKQKRKGKVLALRRKSVLHVVGKVALQVGGRGKLV
jgi:hypothetical protein